MTAARRPLDTYRLADALGSLFSGGIELRAATGSTNTDLRARLDQHEWAGPVVLAAEHQQAGRGRAGHGWQTPPGAALTVSLAFRPERDPATWGWLPLLTGLAVCRAIEDVSRPVEDVSGLAPVLKWPNDVLLPDPVSVPDWGPYRKAVGILTEAVGETVIAGIGINVDQAVFELPVPHAGSLRTAGATGAQLDRTTLLIAVAEQVLALAGGLRDPLVEQEVQARCVTLGQAIEAELPGGGRLSGVAVDIDPDGALIVDTPTGRRTMTAGDLRHVRPRGELGSAE